jgi:hypothetical protein
MTDPQKVQAILNLSRVCLSRSTLPMRRSAAESHLLELLVAFEETNLLEPPSILPNYHHNGMNFSSWYGKARDIVGSEWREL